MTDAQFKKAVEMFEEYDMRGHFIYNEDGSVGSLNKRSRDKIIAYWKAVMLTSQELTKEQ